MLNGVDVTGLRRLAADVARDSWEAQLSARVLAARVGSDHCRATTLTSVWGSTRMVRPFDLDVFVGDAAARAFDPVTVALSALGACVTTTAVTSLSLQGVEPTAVLATVSYTAAEDAGGRVEYALDVEGDIAPETAVRAVEHVRAFSPIHRTFADAREVRLVVASADGRQEQLVAEPARPAVASGIERTATVCWNRGFYVRATPSDTVADAAAIGTVSIDQPKQLFGVDHGPSPLECLLAALGAEALSTWQPAHAIEAHVSGRLDLRGSLGVGDAPVGARDVLVQLLGDAVARPAGGTEHAEDDDRIAAWLASGRALALVRDRRPLDASLRVNDKPVQLPA